MGMFDYLTVKIPLPGGVVRECYQTKSLPAMWLDEYEIREDGTLWHQDYDTEDRSEPNSLAGSLTPVNKRWVPVNYTGEVRFHSYDRNQDPVSVAFVALFVDGRMTHVAEEPR